MKQDQTFQTLLQTVNLFYSKEYRV